MTLLKLIEISRILLNVWVGGQSLVTQDINNNWLKVKVKVDHIELVDTWRVQVDGEFARGINLMENILSSELAC